MKKLGQVVFIAIFILAIFLVPVLTKLEKYKSTSYFENRTLAKPPVLNTGTFFSGEFFGQWETYLSDHIFKRNTWIKTYSCLNMLVLQKHKINNIVIGEDGFLLPYNSWGIRYDAEQNEKAIIAMVKELKELGNHIKSNGGSFYFVGIPGQSSYYKDKYPKHFQNNAQLRTDTEKLMFSNLAKEEVSYINMNHVYKASPDRTYYYKSDHHYTIEGAYAAYYQIITALNKDTSLKLSQPLQKSDLEIVNLPNPFSGSRNRQLYNMYPMEENLQIAYQKHKISYEKYTNGKRDDKLFYLADDKNKVITYSIFMGGDWAETVIKTNREGMPNLLIFGDSFTNAIEPLLYYHFNETRILDLRHYKEMSIYQYIEKYKPDAVIMVRDDLNYSNPDGNGNFKGDGQLLRTTWQ